MVQLNSKFLCLISFVSFYVATLVLQSLQLVSSPMQFYHRIGFNSSPILKRLGLTLQFEIKFHRFEIWTGPGGSIIGLYDSCQVKKNSPDSLIVKDFLVKYWGGCEFMNPNMSYLISDVILIISMATMTSLLFQP